MKISCRTIEEFLTNMPEEAAGLYRGVVYYNRERRPIRGENYSGGEDTSFEVGYQVSAVLNYVDGNQALLEAGEMCGIDRETADGDSGGTDRMNVLHCMVTDYCKARSMKTMPGIIDAN